MSIGQTLIDNARKPPTKSDVMQLPIRSERVVVQTSITPTITAATADALTSVEGYDLAAALKPFTDYIVFRIPHRGTSTAGVSQSNLPAYYRFLINPRTIQISHQMLDSQAMTRDGWKFGVWGETFVQITFSGKTAGQYFNLGLTDMFREFTESYHNLLELQNLFDNNGYWFEGETPAKGTSPSTSVLSSLTKRRIKMHQDVEVFCGEMIWSGMFDRLTVTQSADTPFLSDFTLNFTAWKERYRHDSPYRNSLPCNLQRGHTYQVFDNTAVLDATDMNSTTSVAGKQAPITEVLVPKPGTANPTVTIWTDGGFIATNWDNNGPQSGPQAQEWANTQAAAACAAAAAADGYPISTSKSYTPTVDIQNPTGQFWNGFNPFGSGDV